MPKLEEIMKPIDQAPKDGSMVIARFREFNANGAPYMWQPVWWMPDSKGKNPRWRRFGLLDSTAFADHFVTVAEFAAHGEMEYVQKPRPPEPETQEYDL